MTSAALSPNLGGGAHKAMKPPIHIINCAAGPGGMKPAYIYLGEVAPEKNATDDKKYTFSSPYFGLDSCQKRNYNWT